MFDGKFHIYYDPYFFYKFVKGKTRKNSLENGKKLKKSTFVL